MKTPVKAVCGGSGVSGVVLPSGASDEGWEFNDSIVRELWTIAVGGLE
jgi:hypothetical protein